MTTSDLVVKRTFLEFEVNEDDDVSYANRRRETAPANIGDWLKDSEGSDEDVIASTREPSSGSSGGAETPGKSLESSPANVAHPAFTVLPTPEATPMFGPQVPYGPQSWGGPGMMPPHPMMSMDYFALPDQYNMQVGQDWWPPMDLNFGRSHPGPMPTGCDFDCGAITFGDFMLPDGQTNAQAYGAAPSMRQQHAVQQRPGLQDLTPQADPTASYEGTSNASPTSLAVMDMMLKRPAAPAASAHELATAPAGTTGMTPAGNGKETRTTVMIRNLPEGYTRAMLLECLNAEGFFGRFDFIYVPIDFKRRVNLGYAFINLISSAEAQRFCRHFEGFSGWGMPTDAACTVSWSNPHQGLTSHIERYRNSPVMHESVPNEWRPMLFKHGVAVPFPPPTKNIKAPKVKSAS